MNEQFRDFRRRVGRIDRSYDRRVPDAFVMRTDGLVVQGKARSRYRFYFPWRALLASFGAALVTKAFLIFYMGQDAYVARVQPMIEGSAYPELATILLLPDRITQSLSQAIAAFAAALPF